MDRAARCLGVEANRCTYFQVGQGLVLRMLTAYLEKIAATAPPAGKAGLWGKSGPIGARRGAILADISKIARMRQGYIDLAAAGDILPEEMRAALGKMEERRAAMQEELDATDLVAQAESPAPLGPALARSLLGVLADETRTVRQKRDEMRLAIEYITVWPGKDGLDVVVAV